MIAIDESTIESLTLYDEAEAEIGSADKIDDDRWHCEFRWAGQVYTAELTGFYPALAWMESKQAEWMGGKGAIDALAEFQLKANPNEQSAIITFAGNPQDRMEGTETDPGI